MGAARSDNLRRYLRQQSQTHKPHHGPKKRAMACARDVRGNMQCKTGERMAGTKADSAFKNPQHRRHGQRVLSQEKTDRRHFKKKRPRHASIAVLFSGLQSHRKQLWRNQTKTRVRAAGYSCYGPYQII